MDGEDAAPTNVALSVGTGAIVVVRGDGDEQSVANVHAESWGGTLVDNSEGASA